MLNLKFKDERNIERTGSEVRSDYRGIQNNGFSKRNNNELIVRNGDIFYVNLDGIGSEQKGERPWICVQNDIGNKYSPTIIVAAITSQISKPKLPTHVGLKVNGINGLDKDSVVLLEQLRTIDKRRLKGCRVGFVSEEEMESIDNALDVSIHNKKQSNRYYSASEKFEREVFDIYKAKKLAKNIIELEKFINKYDNPEVNPIKDTVKTLIDELTEYCGKFNKNISLFYKLTVNNCVTKHCKGEVAIG